MRKRDRPQHSTSNLAVATDLEKMVSKSKDSKKHSLSGIYLLMSKETITKEFDLLSVCLQYFYLFSISKGNELWQKKKVGAYLKNSISGWRCLSLPTRKLEVPALLVLELVLLWRE